MKRCPIKLVVRTLACGWQIAAAALLAGFGAYEAAGQEPPLTNNIVLWLKADSLAAGTNGTPVALWADSSTNGYDATQAGDTNQPALWNVRYPHLPGIAQLAPTVRFDTTGSPATSDRLVTPSIPAMAQMSLFMVARSDVEYVGLTYVISSDDYHALIQSGTKWQWFRSGVVTDIAVVDIAAYQILAVTNASSGAGAWTIGAHPSGDFAHDGDIDEILVYNTQLSAEQSQSVTSYLSNKWVSVRSQRMPPTNGLTLWLPADGIAGVTNGGRVATWLDCSGRLPYNDGAQTVETNQPVLAQAQYRIRGAMAPTVRFDGADDYLVLPAIGTMTNLSIFMIARSDVASGEHYVLPCGDDTLALIQGFSNPGKWSWCNHDVYTVLTNIDVNTFQILAVTNASSSSGAWRIGRALDYDISFDGDIGEIVAYNYWLSASESQSVVAYLQNKWMSPPAGAVMSFR